MATKGKRFLLGCGIGCGALLLIALVVVISFSIWVSRPGELLQQERLLSGDALGFLQWDLSLDDPGTRQFLDTLYENTRVGRRAGQTPLPPELERMLLGWQDERNRKGFEEMFPLSAGWLLLPGGEGQDERQLFSLSLQKAGNRLVFTDWVLGLTLGLVNEPEAGKIGYREENLYRFGAPGRDPLVVFLRGNDLFFTSDLDTARHAVDRLLDPPGGGVAGAVPDLLRRAPDGSALRGALGNARGEVFRSWEKIAAGFGDRQAVQALCDALDGVVLSGGLAEDGTLRGRLDFLGPDEAWASQNAETLAAALVDSLNHDKLELQAAGRAEGSTAQVDFQLGGFAQLLESLEDDLPVRVQ